MFVGRYKELQEIKDSIKNPGNHILVYGPRRVGKTTLIQQALKNTNITFISFECIKSSLHANLNLLTDLLVFKKLINPGINFTSFISLFQYLNSLNERIVILIDEYPYLYEYTSKNLLDSTFQNIIDNYSSNLNIVLSGSHIGMMKTLIESSNSLYARFKSYIHLKEMDYLEASLFYKDKTYYEKIELYSIFGGSPFILSQLDYSKSLEELIKSTYLNTHSSIKIFLNEGFTTEDSIRNTAQSIFKTLANHKLKYNEIENRLGLTHNGLLSKMLKPLLDMELIEKIYPINKKDNPKHTTYVIKSNSIKFYYTYVFGMDNLINIIGCNNYYETNIKNSIITFISYRFEDISRTFISKLAKKSIINDVLNIGTYYYNDSINKTNGEFDIVVETKNGYIIFEAKFHQIKITHNIISKEINQIKNITHLNIIKTGFISISGYEDKVNDIDYLFEGKDLYFE